MSAQHLNPPPRRIIIEMSGGMITGVFYEGEGLADVACYAVDYDTNSADEGEVCTIRGGDALLTGQGMEPADEELSRDFRRAYGNWVLS